MGTRIGVQMGVIKKHVAGDLVCAWVFRYGSIDARHDLQSDMLYVSGCFEVFIISAHLRAQCGEERVSVPRVLSGQHHIPGLKIDSRNKTTHRVLFPSNLILSFDEVK